MILQVLIAMIAGWINRRQQQVINYQQENYQQEEIRILKAKLGGQRIRFTDAERRRLAALAFPIDRKRLTSLATLATPDTLMRWYNQLVAKKFDGSQKRNQLGRPHVSQEIEALVLQMAEDNLTWGYRRLQGGLANLGHRIDKITVRNILRRHHIDPHPNAAFMQPCARQLTGPFDGFLLGKRYLIHDRDTKFTQAFDQFLRHEGVEPLVLPPRSPNLNAHCERFVRSITEEALNRIIFIGEGSLRYAIQHCIQHYHQERNHQGLGNQLIAPEPGVGSQRDDVRRRERLGGLLIYYYREAA